MRVCVRERITLNFASWQIQDHNLFSYLDKEESDSIGPE